MKRLMEVCFESAGDLARSPSQVIAADEAATAWLNARDGACAPYSYKECRAIWADDKQPMSARVAAEATMKAARRPALERAKNAAMSALKTACREPAREGSGYDRGSGYGMNSED